MTTIIIDSELLNADKGTGIYLTQAGALTLATPCAFKDYISNNRRNADGRDYLSAGHRDDTQISVQFVTMEDVGTAMAIFESLITKTATEIAQAGQINITTKKESTTKIVKCLFKSIGSVSTQGAATVFSVNLIKLAKQS